MRYLMQVLIFAMGHRLTSFWVVFLFTALVFVSVLISLVANSGDPDQMPRSAASDLGLHCLAMSHKKNATLICHFSAICKKSRTRST